MPRYARSISRPWAPALVSVTSQRCRAVPGRAAVFSTAIAHLCITENSFALEERLSTAMTELARPLEPDIVVGMPTLGMVLAASVGRKLGANVVGVVTAIRETRAWIDKLAAIDPAYPALGASPIRCPLFLRVGGGWAPDWATLPD